MQVGVNILNFGPGAEPATLLRWAQVSEALGYHSVMISDHVAITPSVAQRYPEPLYDTFTTLAWLAGSVALDRMNRPASAIAMFERYARGGRSLQVQTKGKAISLRTAVAYLSQK